MIAVRAGALAALLAGVPYILWLIDASGDAARGTVRAFTALAAAALLGLARRVVGEPALRPASIALWSAALLGALAAWLWPLLWSPAAGLCAAGLALYGAGMPGLRRHAGAVALCATAFPFERIFTDVDGWLSTWTARCAAPLVRGTGLPAELMETGTPAFLLPDFVLVRVAAPCAGVETFLGFVTLGLVLADVFYTEGRAKALFVALLVPIGFVGNVVRVAASTVAADAYLREGVHWDLAHDLIRYAAMIAIFAAVAAAVALIKRAGAVASRAR